MTECNTKLPISFKTSKPLCAEFTGGDLSSDGGLLLLRGVEERLELCKGLSECIFDSRDPQKITHTIEELLRQRILQIGAGYEDCSDATMLRKDPLFKACCNKLALGDMHLASQPTLSRLENSMTKKDISRLRNHFLATYFKQFTQTPEVIVLDIDGFDDPAHGNQEFSFFHGYYGQRMYYPVMINDASTGYPIVLELRPGNSHPGKGVKGILRWLFWRIRAMFPGVRIVLRGDAGFSLPEIVNVCERSEVEYVLGYGSNQVLKRKNEFYLEQARLEFIKSGKKARLFNDVYYAAHDWKIARRIVMKAECHERGINQRFVITNSLEDPKKLYDEFYVLRGEASENRIKELKLDIKADRLSCSQYISNQFRLILYQASFIVMIKLREFARGTKLQVARISTLRNLIVKIAVKVKQSHRRILIQFPTSFPLKNVFSRIASAIAIT